ncbi:MAG: hypothetical protein VXW22_17175, partial [Pseudomonadota bacterium]|nr:hypothetical protein [Pseudomonadota bacterium]
LGDLNEGSDGTKYSTVANSDLDKGDYEEVVISFNKNDPGYDWGGGHSFGVDGMMGWYRQGHMDIGGKRTRAVIEVQSDFHQRGRKRGYGDHSPENLERVRELQRRRDQAEVEINELREEVNTELGRIFGVEGDAVPVGETTFTTKSGDTYKIVHTPPGQLPAEDVLGATGRARQANHIGLKPEEVSRYTGQIEITGTRPIGDGERITSASKFGYVDTRWVGDQAVNDIPGIYDVIGTAPELKDAGMSARQRLRTDVVSGSEEQRLFNQLADETEEAHKDLTKPAEQAAFRNNDQWVTVLAGDAIRNAVRQGEEAIAFPANAAMVSDIEGGASAAP